MRAPSTIEPISHQPFQKQMDRLPVEQKPSAIEPAVAVLPPSDHGSGRGGRFLRTIARRLSTVLCVTLAVVIVAVVSLRFVTPLYTVSAQIMVQRIAAGAAAQSAEDRQRNLRNEQDLVVSTPVLASALTAPGVHDISPLRGHLDALKIVKQQLRLDTHGDDLLNISYDAADPREGTRLLDAVVAAYVRFRSGLHEILTDGSMATVEAEKQKAIANFNQKQEALRQFGAEHGLAQGTEQVDAADAVLHELAIKLAQAHVETITARAEYDDMQRDFVSDPRMRDTLAQSKENDSSLAGGDEQAISKQICALQSQLAGYGTKFMANYAPVQLLHRKIDDLKLTRDVIIQQRWEAAVRNESELEASFQQEEAVAGVAQANQQVFDQHKADVAEAQKEVAAIDKQLKDIDSANKSITTMVTVIEPATASDRPTSPRSTLILLLATIGGLCLGCGVAMVRDIRSGGVIEPGSLDQLKMLGDGLPVLARLPAVPRRQLAMNSWRDRMVDSAAEFSHACEQVHQALESITSFSGGRTVVVTSTKAREGKSTLASLLALTLAQTGNRVLLVDANLHSPVQGEIFGIDGDYGLGNLLEEEIESDFASCVHPGNDDRMDVLLSGASTAAFADLLNSQRFTDLLAAMAAEYDCVLIDSPALAAGPEARIIASSCDATLILANESGINKKVLKQTRDSLTSVGGNVIGVVLNGGMPAIGTVDAVVNIDVSHHAPVRPGVQVTAAGPARVTTPIPIPAPEPVQSVFAAQVRRVVDEEAEVSEPVLPEVESEVDRFGWIWSYSLVAILLLGAWMAFHGLWGASRIVGTLMSPAQEPLTMLMAGSGLLVAMLLAGFQVRPPRQDIALIVLGGILAAVTLNGGAINTLWSSQQHAAITSSTAQTILLFATLLFGWSVVRRTRMAGPLNIADPIVASDVALAVFAQASAMSAMMILLSHWHSKGECLAVIAFSSCLATMLAYWMAPLRSSLCFWLSPFAVALFGYLCAAASAQGIHVSMLMALARPMPLDYASMGTIGAMLGFWIARCAGRIAWPTG